jgi:hypothetical protein
VLRKGLQEAGDVRALPRALLLGLHKAGGAVGRGAGGAISMLGASSSGGRGTGEGAISGARWGWGACRRAEAAFGPVERS